MTYGYMRVSGKSQVDGEGFPRQLAAIETKALACGWVLDGIYKEQGITGASNGLDRPAWASLIGICNRGDRIVIEKLDRFARELVYQEVMMQDLRRRGIELVSAIEDDIDSADPTKVLMRQVLGAIAQYDKAMLTAKLRHARQCVKARTGRCDGKKPYGYRQGESAVIKRMLELRTAGLSYDAIAGTLNADGIKTRSGGSWNAGTVCKILRRQPVALAA